MINLWFTYDLGEGGAYPAYAKNNYLFYYVLRIVLIQTHLAYSIYLFYLYSDDENMSRPNEFGWDMDDPSVQYWIPFWSSRFYSNGISQIQLLIYCPYITCGSYRFRARARHIRVFFLKTIILGNKLVSWSLDEEKERIWRSGNSQSRPLVLQKYGWRERHPWTIGSPLVFSLFKYLVYLSYLCYWVRFYTYFDRVSD